MNLTPYARVSTAEQAKKYSIDTQLAEMAKYAEAQNITLGKPYIEAASASKIERGRPVFQRGIKHCLAGASDGLIMCWFDRAFRNLFEYLQTKSLLLAKGKVLYLALQPQLNIEGEADHYTKFMQYIFVALAELQADTIGDKARRGQIEKAKRGEWPGQIPVGYHRVNGLIEPHPVRGPAITLAFSAYASGRYTLKTWTVAARAMGITTNKDVPMVSGQWNKVFKNEFYTGWVNWAGVRVQGNHLALVDHDTWTRVQVLLGERGSPARQKHVFVLTGLLWSDVCDKPMTGVVAKGIYRYYEARAGAVTQRHQAHEIEQRVINALTGVWWSGAIYQIQDAWLIALRGLDCAQIYPLLRNDQEKQQFLERIIATRGVVIGEGGAILELKLRSGFERR